MGFGGDGGAFFIFCVEEGKGLQAPLAGLTASCSGSILAMKHIEFGVWRLSAKSGEMADDCYSLSGREVDDFTEKYIEHRNHH
ncbi:MAG: hypothetical protein WBH57_12265 [Anaerolineae bacterium]